MTIDDLLTPRGRLIAAALWPKKGRGNPLGYSENDVGDKLTEFLKQGMAQAASLTGDDRDDAAKAWVYYLAYDERYQVMVQTPSSAQTSQGASMSYTDAQRAEMMQLRDDALAEFKDLIASAAPEPIARLQSASVPVSYGF